MNGIRCKVIECSALSEKPSTLARALVGLPDHEIAVCSDAFDVLCVAGSGKLLEGFYQFRSDILFGAERLCFHHLDRSISAFNAKHPETERRYLNSGMFMGRVGAIRDMLATISMWNVQDLEHEFATGRNTQGFCNDQTLFGAYFTNFPDAVTLDVNSLLFWNITGDLPLTNDLLFDGAGCLFNEKSGSSPSFVHFTRLKEVTYLLFLRTASEMGISLGSRNCDSDLLRVLLSSPSSMSQFPYGVSSELKETLSAIPAVQLARLLVEFGEATKKSRMRIGRHRRSLACWLGSLLNRGNRY